jgi:TetR/AcrR family transcriptional regulator of autoinduction and epiphytic fitness
MTSKQIPPPSRAERTRQTRQRMLDSARELILAQGFPDTTMTQIAEQADVAVQTLYYTFKTKGRLLVEVVEVTAAGGDPMPVPQRAWYREMMASPNAQRLLALEIEHGTAISTAVSDPFVAEWWEGIGSGRRRAQHAQVVRVSELGGLKPGLTIDQATDLLFLFGGHASYRALVQDAGWPFVEYKAWLFTTLVQQLIEASTVDHGAVADLSFAHLVPFADVKRQKK